MLIQGTILTEKYQIIQLIGKSGIGSVYWAEDITDHTEWAIKENLLTTAADRFCVRKR